MLARAHGFLMKTGTMVGVVGLPFCVEKKCECGMKEKRMEDFIYNAMHGKQAENTPRKVSDSEKTKK